VNVQDAGKIVGLPNAPRLDHELIAEMVESGSRVLDVGCGDGELLQLLTERKGVDGSRFLLCPMPGLVKAIAVKVGQEVKTGEQLCVVEAMKMENVLNAERDATIKAILAKEGDSLAVDAVIMEFA